MRRLLFALPAAVLLAGCLGAPADSPTEPTFQLDRTSKLLLKPSADAQFRVPAPLYARTQRLNVAGAASLESFVIDFESLAAPGTDATYMATYTEDGFTLVSESNSSESAFASPQSDNTDAYEGSAALVNNEDNGVTALTKDDGGTFNAESIDLAELWTFGEGSRDVPFTGTRADGSTVSQTFTTDGIRGFQTFTFEGFTDLVSLSWIQLYPYHEFDNISLTVGTADPQDPQDPQPKTGTVDHTACLKGGWSDLGFKNQGQCVRFAETGKDSR